MTEPADPVSDGADLVAIADTDRQEQPSQNRGETTAGSRATRHRAKVFSLVEHRTVKLGLAAVLFLTAVLGTLVTWRGILPRPVRSAVDQLSGQEAPSDPSVEVALPDKLEGSNPVKSQRASTAATDRGWGPDRTVWNWKQSDPSFAVLNSVRDNPNLGDERNFLTAKNELVAQDGGWVDRIAVSDRDTYLLRVYVRNDGPSWSDVPKNHPATQIQGLSLEVYVPPDASLSQEITAYLDAENSEVIWDSVKLISDRPFTLHYRPGTSRLYSNAHPTPGLSLSDDVLSSTGVPLGYEKMDGRLSPGFEYAAYVFVPLVVEFED